MFAGPNGSGKTTIKNELPQSLFQVYVNPDEIEKSISQSGVFDLSPFHIAFSTQELQSVLTGSEFLRANGLAEAASTITCRESVIDFGELAMNSYYASVLSDAIRRRLLASSISFTFETVMSSRDKVELLREARSMGYRTYLYFLSTEDPSVNVDRVRNRVTEGGHSVPVDKIVARWSRSMSLVREAVRHTNRAFFFDTSESDSCFVAEITEGTEVELKTAAMPRWFRKFLWEQF